MLKSLQLIFGFYPRRIVRSLKALSWYRADRKIFKKQAFLLKNNYFPLSSNFPCLLDRDEEGGCASGHYFHQDLLVAQQVFNAVPQKHVDIGSRIDGLVAHIASFREVEVMDIRPMTSNLTNINYIQADCMADDLPFENYCDSVSSLHAIEHFGLGRYGDPIDVNGHEKGLNNIYKLLRSGGTFYFSVPMGGQRVEFNAHRVFGLTYLLDFFKDKYYIKSFSYVDDKGDLHKDVTLTDEMVKTNCGCNYGCCIFTLQKIGN